MNNCADPNGGWALGCRIDGGQTEYVRVPYADQGLNLIPDSVSDEQALFVGDILATGFWAARISEITEEDTVLVIGAGSTGICTLLCVMLRKPQRIVVCEQSSERIRFVREHYPQVEVVTPEECKEFDCKVVHTVVRMSFLKWQEGRIHFAWHGNVRALMLSLFWWLFMTVLRFFLCRICMERI